MVPSGFALAMVAIAAVILMVECRPQGGTQSYQGGSSGGNPPNSGRPEVPMPYNYDWKVNDQEKGNYYGHKEEGTAAGRVDGSYYVWLPDGRLMTVTYYVDGESGFVPTITFSDNAQPFGG